MLRSVLCRVFATALLAGVGSAAWAQEADTPTTEPQPVARATQVPPTPAESQPALTEPPVDPIAASQPASQPEPEQRPGTAPVVVFEVGYGSEEWGKIVVELYPDRAPRSVKNFLEYVDQHFYDGTIFHRILPGYLVQAGGYTSLVQKREEGLRAPVPCESENGLKNEKWTFAAARTAEPHTATSQFFINLAENAKLDHPGHDGWGYCVFGRVIDGYEVVQRIRDSHTRIGPDLQRAYVKARRTNPEAPPPENSQPLRPPMIKRAYRDDAAGQTASRKPPADNAVAATPAAATPAATPAPGATSGVGRSTTARPPRPASEVGRRPPTATGRPTPPAAANGRPNPGVKPTPGRPVRPQPQPGQPPHPLPPGAHPAQPPIQPPFEPPAEPPIEPPMDPEAQPMEPPYNDSEAIPPEQYPPDDGGEVPPPPPHRQQDEP